MSRFGGGVEQGSVMSMGVMGYLCIGIVSGGSYLV